MDYSCNIFKNIEDSPNGRLKKVFRNTLHEGILDTYQIIKGNHGLDNLLEHKRTEYIQFGLIDLLVLPPLCSFLVHYSLYTNTPEVKKDVHEKISLAILIIGLLLQGVRILLAMLLTISIIPLILLVHTMKYPFLYVHTQQFYNLENAGQDELLASFVTRINAKNLNDLQYLADTNTKITAKSLSPFSDFFVFNSANVTNEKQINALYSGQILGVL